MRAAKMNLRSFALALLLTLPVVCCAAASGPGASTAPDSSKPQHKKGTLRVLYWNIQNGMWAGQPDNYQQFVDWVNAWNPDICVFCEAAQIYYDGTSEHMPNEERYLPAHWGEFCARWGHDYHIVTPRRVSTSTPFGLSNYPHAITARWPIDTVALVMGHKPDSVVVNPTGWDQLHVPGVEKPLNIVPVHLKHGKYGYGVPHDQRNASAERYEGEFFRVNEVTYILDHTVRQSKNPDKELWIMPGDYNSYSRRDNFKYKWNNASLGFTTQDYMLFHSPFFDLVSECFPDFFRPTCGNLRIDYMYVSKPMLDACTEIYEQPDSYTNRVHSGVATFYIPSDHYPIIADFKISKMK